MTCRDAKVKTKKLSIGGVSWKGGLKMADGENNAPPPIVLKSDVPSVEVPPDSRF